MAEQAPRSKSNTRSKALRNLAYLSVRTVDAKQDEHRDIDRLCSLCTVRTQETVNGSIDGTNRRPQTSDIPMGIRELEVLVALCRAAPSLQTTNDAGKLLQQLAPYLLEVHRQSLASPPLYQQRPPWEKLSFDLTSAILAIGLNHPSLRHLARATIDLAITEFTNSAQDLVQGSSAVNGDDIAHVPEAERPAIQLTVALVGFLDAVAEYMLVWTPEQRTSVIHRIRHLLSEEFMVSEEGSLSAVRNSRNHLRSVKNWKQWIHHYATNATPLGAMLLQQRFMRIVETTVALLLSEDKPVPKSGFLDILLHRTPMLSSSLSRIEDRMLGELTDVVVDEMDLLDADADYLQLSSSWQQRLALEVKASCLRSYLFCSLINEDIADDELLTSWFDAITTDTAQMADRDLTQTVFKSMAVLARLSSATALNFSRTMPRLLVHGRMPAENSQEAGHCLALILGQLSEDIVISTLYSLGNVLSTSAGIDKSMGPSAFFNQKNGANGTSAPYVYHEASGSQISLNVSDEGDTAAIYNSVIDAIVSIATVQNDEKLTALVLSMLVQKIGRIGLVVDAKILTEIAFLGLCGGIGELKSILKLYARVGAEATVKHDNLTMNAVTEARIRLATWIKKDSFLYEPYLTHLLELCVSSGDTAGERLVNFTLATETISQLLRPLAILSANDVKSESDWERPDELLYLSRDAWFNIVIHGFTLDSTSCQEHIEELQILALHSLPLVDEDRVDLPESGIDLNTVLRRGSSQQRTSDQRSALINALPQCEAQIKELDYSDCVFLNTALLVCILRARAGDCTGTLPYFLENKVKKTGMGNVMLAIAMRSIESYLYRAVAGREPQFAASQVATQLISFFEGACHRIPKVQLAAVASADRIIAQIPSALCQKASLFALLELLTLMWKSCLDAETDEYDWKPIYSSEKADVSIRVSDDLHFRQTTLTNFHQRCRSWVSKAIDSAPLNVKGLLQAYLEDYEDDGTYGHVVLGRSFAVEMGATIPNTDQRLVSLNSQKGLGLDTASDFMAQYTTRQEYRHVDRRKAIDEDWALVEHDGTSRRLTMLPSSSEQDDVARLTELSNRVRQNLSVPFAEVRETLRAAAAVVSSSQTSRTQLVTDLVGVPFRIFTKQAINFATSLWLGMVKDNPDLETRILAEIAAGWEASVRSRRGFFDSSLQHLDPFYIKEEFAPSKWESIRKRQQLTHDKVAPHLRLTLMLASHFNASRLIAPSIESTYCRLARVTMLAMRRTVSQPLGREVHFQIVLLAFRILKYSTRLSTTARWSLKDAILSAGLAWFALPPRWSFGSNKLQLKAELRVLDDVLSMLTDLRAVGTKIGGSLQSLEGKQDLLHLLVTHEISHLEVWVNPLGSISQNVQHTENHAEVAKESAYFALLTTAWEEDPRIAVQLATRLPISQTLTDRIRTYIVKQPERVLHEPDALYILLGSSLPSDIDVQLKYLLYWAPVNPMAAVTYFLPAYANHPLIIQYGERALNSHSVDVTFFYVPQIVQTLRYDALGYVERYIIEAATFSQLFAHQIIWNIKANAYKDEEATEPDPAKPVLDRVMDALIASFSSEDRVFYEREFDFFNKVTGISGKLKPFIKSPKPEKKQKIEEELRKIQVEVGVYLPSNPDGVVVGIDRKSGKPLQSHAKAPYMATFRIRREEAEEAVEDRVALAEGQTSQRSYEVWQSAIFKVGDDCRQDVLALQMIAAFRGIFNNVGLDVYVFPYRVTATAPGCGVIDVLPNSISRDMLGREAVNGLYEYFVSKYGYEDSIRFQEARSNFLKSMAAYSIISFLLQFKDRHNGNIMIDDAGHILHIDFGFCFDVAPGGIKFERAPFKLTPEMVAVMGGSTQSQPFRAFEELCVKAFLAARQHVEQLSHIVLTMLDSGLPCFKPQTMKHFKERFVLEKTEREAAEFVRHLVHVSERSYSTGVYDYFQLLTNGIPY